ncbi:MAG: tRNA (N6-isopentenyl adenosine(37)-C2)-methylthiotransferase MiaB [Dehalococcoidales bacterium]|nr:tRNA (N6-isopentenyl adenosine(37)-C2)-methylthiotransferase MiaB [Dehalococcoidales bacterium]MDP6221995.1 tRNA (N6-isopentenyl adenosine(37)-C2)-methylthiotransferase MiaB [Dehalococcoidales bacterium]MDP7109780.1 tRNA (N6-isopentenyl adenosine(37)-C2)-methylthiotransferase MiaB [Dehalococcoidales bacterium]MDP7310252.1 tRNA (N6-isopentenyl adenosine(37)-C2)-methylthiotransferase MiaB [Dehalococcoidales bacterium]MDP7409244.1 tRNA (N6-isopentenyl adenosine(37)-C2)-methylthiotransferase Mia
MPRYHIWTIGCQMNKAESERLASFLEQRGYQAAVRAESADIIVLNSCVVRDRAENRVINKLHTIKSLKKLHPNVTLAVTGCLVDSNTEEMKKDFPHVDYFFKPGDFPSWLNETECSVFNMGQTLPRHPSTSVYVPIIQGCDQFCSYCIVPYRRGREKSHPLAEIVCEVRELVRRGVKEIILLGQNVDAYGHDLSENSDLAGLLGELNTVDDLVRLRFLTNHPKDMNAGLIDAVARLDKVCEQINLPVQSGSNTLLEIMGRGYTVERYRELIAELRQKIPGVALSTDVIVGFPSESEEQFRQTEDLLADLKFDTVHVAAYSIRPGTIAARELKDDVPSEEKKRRLKVIEQLQVGIAAEINARLLGQTVEVLVESKEKGKWRGRTRSDKLVFFGDQADRLGQLVNVRVERTSPWSLQGKSY